MKKHLIAAAVAAAVAVPAMAQNVNLSGRVDAGYSMTSTTTSQGVKTDTDAISYGSFTTSRLTFTGSEDLGGGLKADFNIETALSGAATGGSNLGDRHFFARLSGNFGNVLAGRTDSMTKALFDTFDAGFANSMTQGNIKGLDDSVGAGVRDVTIRYTTPTFSGVTASVGIMKNTVDASNSTKVNNITGEEFGLRYAGGPLNAGLAYRSVKSSTAAVAGTAGSCADVSNVNAVVYKPAANTCASRTDGADADILLSGTNPVDRTETENNDLGLGVSYDLGTVVLFGQYFDNEIKNKVAGTKTDEKFYAIGARVPLGAATLFASYTDGESKTATTTVDRQGYQLGVKYDLSKRTSAYLMYGDQEKDVSGGGKDKGDQTAFGIVHMF